MDDFVHEYYHLDKFKAVYRGVIEPMPDKSQWPRVDLGYLLQAPLGKSSVGRQQKLWITGCLEAGGSGKKKKAMIRGPVKCKRCGEMGHRQASYKCPLNGTKKKPPRKPRKNITKMCSIESSTPQRSSIASENIILDGPSQLHDINSTSSSQRTVATSPSPKRTTTKKLTPKKRKRN